MDANETGKVLEALLTGNNDALHHLWMSCSDPMECPVIPRLWREMDLRPGGRPDEEILALMIDTRRW